MKVKATIPNLTPAERQIIFLISPPTSEASSMYLNSKNFTGWPLDSRNQKPAQSRYADPDATAGMSATLTVARRRITALEGEIEREVMLLYKPLDPAAS